MPKVVWTSENDRKLLIRLIERSAKSYDTVELCKMFPGIASLPSLGELVLTGGTNSQGATPKAIEERIAKLKREAKAMDHPKPRNHPKGKSGPKKRVATDASLTPLETADLKKIKVMMDPEDSITGPVIDPTTDPTEDSMTDPFPVSDESSLCPAKTEDEELSSFRSPCVKYEFELGLEPEFDTDTDSEPSAEPSTDAEAEPELESEFEPEYESELDSEFRSEGEEIETRKLCLIKSEPEIFKE